jgi:mannose-6-phosphate isomerase-like protein (cupin superfamily)
MRTRTLATLVACTLAAGLHASAANGQVTHLPADRTAAAFAKGQPLIETPTYKVHASRREAPGQAEVHEADTDIFYVLDGTATVVTGGRIAAARTISPGELRGRTIEGGTLQRLAKGDVFIVPSGVAHQFTEVSAPFLYYTVKVTTVRPGGGQP